MDSLEAFLHPTILTGHTTHTYETHAAIDNASRNASNTSNIGVDEVRKLAKTAKMLGDPDMEDHLARMTEKFCEHMLNVCELIKAVKANRATQGLQLIAVVRDLFSIGLIVSKDCPVQELFTTQFGRLTAANNVSEEAIAAWEEEHGQDTPPGDGGYAWKEDVKAWLLPLVSNSEDSSDGEEGGEKEWLNSVSTKWDHAGKVPRQPTAQTTMAYWFGNGVTKTTEKQRMPDGKERQVPGEAKVLMLPKMADESASARRLWADVVWFGLSS
jgi:hypothetical protein